jgi:hypothetical protein
VRVRAIGALTQQEHEVPSFAGLQQALDLQRSAGVEPCAELAGQPPLAHGGWSRQITVTSKTRIGRMRGNTEIDIPFSCSDLRFAIRGSTKHLKNRYFLGLGQMARSVQKGVSDTAIIWRVAECIRTL